ncbi:glycine-rich domain-containing protein [Streptomyces griseus]
MTVTQDTAPALRTSARDLITPEEFDGVVNTVLGNNVNMELDVARRITDEALKFLAASASFPGQGLRPSRVVDEGWHALILHTRVYQRLCQTLGTFIHHVPEIGDPTRFAPGILEPTVEAIMNAGYAPDRDLWVGPNDPSIPVAASCQHSPDGGPGTCTGDCSNTGPNVA